MKTRMKRVLSLAISVLMLLTLLPSMGLADTTSNSVIPGEELISSLMAGNSSSTLAITGSTTVKVNETITLTSNKGSNSSSYWHSWESSNTNVARVSNNGQKATVTGVKAGTVTITHRYAEWNGYRVVWKSETYQVTVSGTATVKTESAQVYYLKTPTSNPNSNDTNQWGRNIGNGSVNTTGATWMSGGGEREKNIFNPGPYVVSMARGMTKQSDGSWLLPRSNYSQDYQTIYNAYKEELQNELGITLNSANDIEAIYLTPYKISRNNGSTPDKHIDCTIDVKIKGVFVAKFWVTKMDGTVEMVDAKNYRSGNKVKKTTAAPTNASGDYPQEIDVNGVKYVFDGWYNEANQKVADSSWDYTPTETELADGTVNFYAHYSLKEETVTVSKTVDSSIAAEKQQSFSFTYQIDEESQVSFTLKDGETKEISVPADAKFVVTETSDANFNTSYSIDQETSVSGATATIESVSGDHTIAFTNARKTGSVAITKTVDSAVTADKQKTFTFTCQLGDQAATSFNLKNGETITINGIPIGTKVVVTETSDANFNTSYSIDQATSVSNATATIESVSGDHTIAFTNARKTNGLTVSKVVSGNAGEPTKSFNFSYSYSLNGETVSGTFSLANGQSYTGLTNIPYGTVITVTESDYSADGYVTMLVYKDGRTIGEPARREGSSWSAEIGNFGNQQLTFDNRRELTPDTGVLLDSLPYILILAAIACIGVVVFVRKRREADD